MTGPVFDFHARLAPGAGEPHALLAAMAATGISRAAVSAGGLLPLDRLSAQLNDGGRSEVRADNAWVQARCAESAGRLLPFFFADPARDGPAYGEQAAHFRGLEISPAVHGFALDDPPVRALLTTAAAARHPVYVVSLGRPGTRPTDLVRLARDFPAVTFVWGHCGHTGLDLQGLTAIAPVENIVAELSGCLTITARLAVRRLGAHRVLFGTEYPLQHPRVELAKLAALGLTPAERQAVAWDNAGRLLEEKTCAPT